MPRRVRTTKNLAKRMDLQYFRQPHPLRSWRLWLSVLIPVVALGWFAAAARKQPEDLQQRAAFGVSCRIGQAM